MTRPDRDEVPAADDGAGRQSHRMRRRDLFASERLPSELMPVVEVEGVSCVVETPKLAAMPRRALKERVGSLADRHAEIVGALDFLFQGY